MKACYQLTSLDSNEEACVPLPRYERERDQMAGPKTRRAIVALFGLALLIGLILGLLWVAAGLLRFHVLR